MSDPTLITVSCVFWQGSRYHEIFLQIDSSACIADVLHTLCKERGERSYDDLAKGRVGIFNRLKTLQSPVVAGDRVECYVALRADPKEARHRRLEKAKRPLSSPESTHE